MKRLIRAAARACGYELVRSGPSEQVTEETDREILTRVGPFTMTSEQRQLALIDAVRYIVRRGIPGSIVECGVWRGGSSMAAALALQQERDATRELYLFDTFDGMTAPTEADRTFDGTLAKSYLDSDVSRAGGVWAVCGIDNVRANMLSTGYPPQRIHLVKGPVETTLPNGLPDGPIALLRLDTDWYESTRHELEHLFPRLSLGGLLIIDDYGHWQGARKAVDEYFSATGKHAYLHRIDYTGRLLIK